MYVKHRNFIYLFAYFIFGQCRLASSEATMLPLHNCKLPTVNKFHITNIT